MVLGGPGKQGTGERGRQSTPWTKETGYWGTGETGHWVNPGDKVQLYERCRSPLGQQEGVPVVTGEQDAWGAAIRLEGAPGGFGGARVGAGGQGSLIVDCFNEGLRL